MGVHQFTFSTSKTEQPPFLQLLILRACRVGWAQQGRSAGGASGVDLSRGSLVQWRSAGRPAVAWLV